MDSDRLSLGMSVSCRRLSVSPLSTDSGARVCDCAFAADLAKPNDPASPRFLQNAIGVHLYNGQRGGPAPSGALNSDSGDPAEVFVGAIMERPKRLAVGKCDRVQHVPIFPNIMRSHSTGRAGSATSVRSSSRGGQSSLSDIHDSASTCLYGRGHAVRHGARYSNVPFEVLAVTETVEDGKNGNGGPKTDR